eukprot:7450304-Pyramimonas_sp.AAC.2
MKYTYSATYYTIILRIIRRIVRSVILLRFTGPPVPITARVHSTPHRVLYVAYHTTYSYWPTLVICLSSVCSPRTILLADGGAGAARVRPCRYWHRRTLPVIGTGGPLPLLAQEDP